jgi:hypothetical protein
MSTAEFSASAESSHPPVPKPQRVLACVLCQQRKVKCDRQFPCGNCVKARVQCVPATLAPRQRKRRYPERHLLERLRKYEDLLRQNNIDFVPLHREGSAQKESYRDSDLHDEQQLEGIPVDLSSPSTTTEQKVQLEREYDPK